jgi:polar amino acid transport system substrate-binding protein
MIRSVLSTTGAALLLATSAYAQEPPPLRAAVDGTFAPHAFPNLSGGYQGFNVDLANEIAKRLKRKIVIDAAQFSGLVPALQAGTYDFLAAPTTVTKERAESMLFTEGYLNTDFQFLIKKGSSKVVRLEDLKGAPTPMSPAIPSSRGRSRTTRSWSCHICIRLVSSGLRRCARTPASCARRSTSPSNA